ncbi:hypothetical protein ACJJTC_018972 [Scirpophaga incertulas]
MTQGDVSRVTIAGSAQHSGVPGTETCDLSGDYLRLCWISDGNCSGVVSLFSGFESPAITAAGAWVGGYRAPRLQFALLSLTAFLNKVVAGFLMNWSSDSSQPSSHTL